MTVDRFEELLKELSPELGVPLHPDRRNACKLRINDSLQVQLECDGPQENLLIATFICELPPGKFRETILKDALKSNGPFPTLGILSYSERNNQLVLFASLVLAQLNGKILAEFLLAFIEKATQWRRGVETGQTANLTPTANSSSNIFGLKR